MLKENLKGSLHILVDGASGYAIGDIEQVTRDYENLFLKYNMTTLN